MKSLKESGVIYSLNIKVKKDAELAWVKKMREHLSSMLKSNFCKDFNVKKIIYSNFNGGNEEGEYSNYIIEYISNDSENLRSIFNSYLNKLTQMSFLNDESTIMESFVLEDKFKDWYPIQEKHSTKETNFFDSPFWQNIIS